MGLQLTHATATDECREYETRICDSEQLFIGDVLLFVSLSHLLNHTPILQHFHQLTTKSPKHNGTDLDELLQMSAIEQLRRFRHIQARDIGFVATIVTTDFEALYAYKRGDYQRCLQLCTQNVHTLWYAERVVTIPTFPEFAQLMDDDITSLTALTLIVSPKCRDFGCNVHINQLILSLYLMTQCQLKLHHSVMSLAQILHYTKVAYRRHPVEETLNRLVLKMIADKALVYLTAYERLS